MPRPTFRNGLGLKALLILVVFALLGSSCGSDDSATFRTTGGEFDAPTEATSEEFEFGDEAAAAPDADQLGNGGAGTGQLTTVDFGRDIIFTAQVTIAVATWQPRAPRRPMRSNRSAGSCSASRPRADGKHVVP